MTIKIMILILLVIFAIFIVALTITNSIKRQKKLNEKLNMITHEEYNKIRKSLSNIEDLNNLKKTNNKMDVCILLCIIFIIILLSLMPGQLKLIVLIPSVLLIIFIIIKGDSVNHYTKQYKEKVIRCILNEIDSNLIYMPNNGMEENIYIESGFDNYDRYFSEDLIKGTIFDLNFMASDVHTQDKKEDSDGNTTYVTSFLGMFSYVELNKSINSVISIEPIANRVFGKSEKVLIDNVEFNKHFIIYSNNDIMTLRILTPDVTNKIINLYENMNLIFQIKIVDNKMFFRFDSGNMFEPTMRDEDNEIKNVYIYKIMFDNMCEIVKEIIKIMNELEI